MHFVILYFLNVTLLFQVIFLRKHIILTLYLIFKWSFNDLPQLSILFLQVFKSLETRVLTAAIKETNTFIVKEESISEYTATGARFRVTWLDGMLSF